MPAPDGIKALVNQFDEHIETYKRANYNETQLRREFLDPFFVQLGWDVFNTEGYAGDYKDVVHEAAIKVGGTTKAPDYSFRIGGQRKFFVEAKKPSVDVKGDPHPAFQLRRYAWTAGLPVSILTDFEEFAVYDCRIKPDRKDKASTARIMYMTFREYDARWNEIADVFGKTAILKGAFDKYAAKKSRKRGTAEVDDEFLKELERWRTALARNIARHNSLSARQLNHAVQLIIDRIVFLRICEDRGIEQAGTLLAVVNGDHIYERLFVRFRHADAKYNSGLFHFERESGRNDPDTLTPSLHVGDNVLKDIIKHLYYPDAPYEFSVLPADILGHIYERFLGSIITLSATGKTATVEEKPEVRKAGGVYYTPTYIVDYIVGQTIGELLNDRRLEKKGRGKARGPAMNKPLRALDPACGSGSFLLGAYQCLLDWHLKQYTDKDPESWAKLPTPPIAHRAVADEKATAGEYKLTTHEKKRILTAHIFGVDIDAQAVEVTKLSLLLKVLEGENEETLEPLLFAKERALPDLSQNIKCGNSLIGSDFYDGQHPTMFDEDEQYRINAFDWDQEFAALRTDGGFNAVIGNPPYTYRNSTTDAHRKYYARRFDSAEGNYELYKFFLERSSQLLTNGGRLGMIVSASFLIQRTFAKLRRYLLENTSLLEIAALGPKVFADATVDTAVLVLTPANDEDSDVSIIDPEIPSEVVDCEPYRVPQSRFRRNAHYAFDYRLTTEAASLVQRLIAGFPTIEARYEFGVGINTGFIRSELTADRGIDERYHKMVTGRGISRYGPVLTDGWIMYDPEYVKSRGSQGRTLPPERFFRRPKLLIVRTRNLALDRRIVATLDCSQAYNLNRLSNIISRDDSSVVGLLGILNSRLFNWLFLTRYFDYEIKPVYLRASPLADAEDEHLVHLAQLMLDLMDKLRGDGATKLTPQERRTFQSRLSTTDRQLDERVYQLYGLNEDEIAMVDAATAKSDDRG